MVKKIDGQAYLVRNC